MQKIKLSQSITIFEEVDRFVQAAKSCNLRILNIRKITENKKIHARMYIKTSVKIIAMWEKCKIKVKIKKDSFKLIVTKIN